MASAGPSAEGLNLTGKLRAGERGLEILQRRLRPGVGESPTDSDDYFGVPFRRKARRRSAKLLSAPTPDSNASNVSSFVIFG